MGLNGHLDYEITQGSFTIKNFNLFVRQLLPKLNAFPGPRSVLVLDNAKAHHSADLSGIQRGQEVRAREKGRVFCT
jgi:hypothetical protein